MCIEKSQFFLLGLTIIAWFKQTAQLCSSYFRYNFDSVGVTRLSMRVKTVKKQVQMRHAGGTIPDWL